MKRRIAFLSFLLMICMLIGSIPTFATPVTNGIRTEDTDVFKEADGTNAAALEENEGKEVYEEPDPLEDCSVLKYVDEKEFTSKNFAFRVKDEEALNTYVFQAEDGKRTVYILDENVKFIDETGKVVEKDLALVKTENGYKTAKNDVGVLFPHDLKNGVSFEYDGYTVTIVPVVKENAEAEVKENAVVYNGAFGSKTALKYTPTLSGVKEDVVLTEYVPGSYTFTVDAGELNLYEDSDGWYFAKAKDSKETIRMGKVVAYDANGKPSMGTMSVVMSGEDSVYTVTISADESFLKDENTVYPVTIDPTLTVSYGNNGDNYIIDAPIFEGYPNMNFGTYLFNRVGTPDSSYQRGRTVVKLTGLTASSIYQSITANQINSVLFKAKEASGGSTQNIRLYRLTSNTTWTETDVTWNNIGSYDTSVNYGNSMYNGAWTDFDITNLVKGWKTGTYSADAGFIMLNENETGNNKSFYSSEYTTTDYRPYVVMTYDAVITLDNATIDVDEGLTKTLIATMNPTGQTVTWTSSDSSVATVSSSGVVTGVSAKADPITITASITVGGTTYSASCQVYVTIEDGVYYLKNQNSNYYLHVNGGYISNSTNVIQYSKYSSSTSDAYRIRQMWKVVYLGNGRYSIRPMHKLNMGLDVTSGNVDIWTIGTTDTLSGVPDYAEWTVERYSNSTSGCVLKNGGASTKSMHIESGSTTSGASVVVGAYSATADYRWSFVKISTPPVGVILYNTSSNSYTNNPTKYVAPEEELTLSDLQLTAAVYSGSTINQTLYWLSSDTTIATVDYYTGNIIGVAAGTATITARKYLNGSYQTVSYTLEVTEIQNGDYFIKNKATDFFAQTDPHYMSTLNTLAELNNFYSGPHQKWQFTRVVNNYYKITTRMTNWALSVQSGEETGLNKSLIQESYSGLDRQLWRIDKTSSGAYRIYPKSGEGYTTQYTMACESYSGTPGIGLDVQQRQYVNDTNYEDEWYLEDTSTFVFKSFTARVYYDQSVGLTVSEIKTIYDNAVTPFISNYNLGFVLTSTNINFASTLNCDSSCCAATASDICTNGCATNHLCNSYHHRGSKRLLDLLKSSSYYTYRLVGYALCYYNDGSHYEVIGLGYIGGQDAISSNQTSPNITRSIQHELTHNLGASHDDCVAGQKCVLKGDFGYWCDACMQHIKDNY